LSDDVGESDFRVAFSGPVGDVGEFAEAGGELGKVGGEFAELGGAFYGLGGGAGGLGEGESVLPEALEERFFLGVFGPGVAVVHDGGQVDLELALEDGGGLGERVVGAVALAVGEGYEVDDVGGVSEEVVQAHLVRGGFDDERGWGGGGYETTSLIWMVGMMSV
jgi:hypothetical protein